ncbi:hypothetical protein ELS19_17165 [Halogeometricum borinquense]|uniref:Uncharacterized protein n=1 Tax=Halogeometricum borinquense TaxID=60847 RepID=A0A482T6S8_9EURY|nr:hypothetical protein [Halogeometricum borinquense]RYJ08285.1 hypothetical protein ELS19_17165 [Halogeometricum borinquense]
MSDDKDPLEKVLVDKNEINRKQLADGIDGIIGVDKETGEPAPLPSYHDLNNRKQFVARLLARRASVALDRLADDEVGITSGEAEDVLPVSESTIQNYGSIDFVQNDSEQGGYYIPAYSIDQAIEFIQTDEGDE